MTEKVNHYKQELLTKDHALYENALAYFAEYYRATKIICDFFNKHGGECASYCTTRVFTIRFKDSIPEGWKKYKGGAIPKKSNKADYEEFKILPELPLDENYIPAEFVKRVKLWVDRSHCRYYDLKTHFTGCSDESMYFNIPDPKADFEEFKNE